MRSGGRQGTVPGIGVEYAGEQAGFAAVLAERAEPMLKAVSEPASALLLIGDAGSGKSYMAEYVARAAEGAAPETVRAFVLPRPSQQSSDPEAVFGQTFPRAFSDESPEPLGWLSSTFDAMRLAAQLLALARAEAGEAEPLLVLPGVDHYSPQSVAVLEHLVRQRGMRIIATAHRMAGGANHMGRDPRVTRIIVGPLDLREADALMSSLLGTAHLAPPTLRRWHAATGGNSHALTLMLIANERSGVLRRRQGVARVPEGQDRIPEELVHHLEETCTAEEREALELIALAEPMSETPLLRLLDPAVTNALLERGLVSTQSSPDGLTALRLERPIVATALRARMSPVRRIDLAELFFRALTDGVSEEEFAAASPFLLRAVEFGLESGRHLAHDWLTGAVSRLLVDADPPLMMRVSLALARGYTSEDAAAASLRAVAYATQLGDRPALQDARARLDELVDDPDVREQLPTILLARLRLSQIERHFTQSVPMARVLEELDLLERDIDPAEATSLEAVHSLRFQLLLREGEFRLAAEAIAGRDDSDGIVVEWLRAPALSASSLLLQQQGRLDEAIGLAHRVRSMSVMGRRPLHDTLELQGFHWFLGYWASGSAEGARRALEEIEADAESSRQTGAQLSELAETGWAMLALQEARWRDAADLVELISESAAPTDPYGLRPLLHSVHALALAALGERPPALAALQRAREHRRGLAQSIAGFRMRIALHAQQWLRLGDLLTDSLSLADWAGHHDLQLVELQALHVAAMESDARAAGIRERARSLAAGIDPLIAEVILAHIEKIAEGASPSDVSEPEVRLLAELGLWMPLPRSPGLSPREREIALLASLGYASRFIAERFHLSTRTVETHLAHVYAKLGIVDRSELREWFSVDRRAEIGTRSPGEAGLHAPGRRGAPMTTRRNGAPPDWVAQRRSRT